MKVVARIFDWLALATIAAIVCTAGCQSTPTTPAPSFTPAPARPVPATQPAAAPAVDAAVTRLDAVDAAIAAITAYAAQIHDAILSGLAAQANADANTLRVQLADARGQVVAKDAECTALRLNIDQTAKDRMADAKTAQGLLDDEHKGRTDAETENAKLQTQLDEVGRSEVRHILEGVIVIGLLAIAGGGYLAFQGSLRAGLGIAACGALAFAMGTFALIYLAWIVIIGGCAAGIIVIGVGIYLIVHYHSAGTDLAVLLNNTKTLSPASWMPAIADSTLGREAANMMRVNAPTPTKGTP